MSNKMRVGLERVEQQESDKLNARGILRLSHGSMTFSHFEMRDNKFVFSGSKARESGSYAFTLDGQLVCVYIGEKDRPSKTIQAIEDAVKKKGDRYEGAISGALIDRWRWGAVPGQMASAARDNAEMYKDGTPIEYYLDRR
jgi:hypothetical protein